MQVHHRLTSILRRIRQDVATLLDREAINTACREEGYTWKDRLLNPTNTEQKNHPRSVRYGAAQIVRIFSGSRQTALQASAAASCKAW
jgi:hypothetical protein